jgi:outer membrane protein assembly factor BamA
MFIHGFVSGAPPQSGFNYGRFGVEGVGHIDLYRGDRVLVLRTVHEAIGGKEETIPFTEMARLGGPTHLRGFRSDRFRDNVSLMGTIEYHWPIHEILAGVLFLEAGQVASRYADLVDVREWHGSGGGGLFFRSKGSRILALELAYGEGLEFVVTTDPLHAFEGRGEKL